MFYILLKAQFVNYNNNVKAIIISKQSKIHNNNNNNKTFIIINELLFPFLLLTYIYINI